MKKLYTLLGVSTLLLTGCAERGVYQQYAQAVNSGNSANALALTSYFETKSKLHAEVIKSLAETKNETAIVLYGIIASQGDEKVLANFQSQKIEAPTTNADIGVELARNTIPTLAKVGATAYIGGRVVDALKDSGATHIQGDGNTITGNTGDAQTSALSPVTTTTTTTTNHAPAAP